VNIVVDTSPVEVRSISISGTTDKQPLMIQQLNRAVVTKKTAQKPFKAQEKTV
jgi:hypothetical protein